MVFIFFSNIAGYLPTHGSEASDILINFPKNKMEQRAISTLLSDMDDEISALQQKLAKYRQIKQGMMAELLTGRIRLKEA